MNEEIMERKTPEQLGAEIRMYVDAGRRISLLCGIEIGKRLVQAKEILAHGEWLPWLEKETEFSDRSAARYMKLFEEYGASQMGLFGPETNSPTLSNLPISKALALLSVPESERIEFAEEVDAEHISVRELQEAIREKQEAEARAEAAMKQAAEREELLKTQDGMLVDMKNQIAELAKLNKELENRPVEVAVETVRDEAAIEAAAKAAREKAEKDAERAQAGLQKQLADSEKNLQAAMEKLKTAEDSAKKAEEKAEKLEKSGTAAVEKATKALKEELAEAQKQLKTSAADVTAFGIRFNTIQSEWSYMMAELKKAEARDAETGEKLREAVRHLLEYFRKEAEKET